MRGGNSLDKPDSPLIFITGAGSGIGAATARLFSQAGWRVGLADRDGGAVQALAKELGTGAYPYVVDVLDRETLNQAITEFVGAANHLNVLFNSAGLIDMRPFVEAPLERIEAVLDVNIKGVINGISAAFPFMSTKGSCKIITMSSAAANHGVPDMAVYSASKFAVRGLTEALNIEFEPLGIWVCDIMVAFVDTPMLSKAEHRAKSIETRGIHVTPEMVADTVFKAAKGRQVHWFVRDEDQERSEHMRLTPREDRRERIIASTGYATSQNIRDRE